MDLISASQLSVLTALGPINQDGPRAIFSIEIDGLLLSTHKHSPGNNKGSCLYLSFNFET